MVILDTQEKKVLPLVAGADFYAHPKFSPDGTKLAYQYRNHPNMPWENSEIVLADVSVTNDIFSLSNATTISSHGSNNFPSWANNNTLCWVCDISGFINPWKYSVSSARATPILPSPVQDDFGGVMWRLCFCPYAIIDEAGTTAVWAAYRNGSNVLYEINIETGELKELDSPYVAVECMRTVSRSKHQFTFLGGKVDEATKVILGSAPRGGAVSFVPINQSNEEAPYDPSLISIPQGISLKVPPNDEFCMLFTILLTTPPTLVQAFLGRNLHVLSTVTEGPRLCLRLCYHGEYNIGLLVVSRTKFVYFHYFQLISSFF